VDIGRLLGQFADERAEVVLVGGWAAIAHGVVHLTNDVDFCYAPDPANVERVVRALAPLRPRLRVEGLTDEQAAALPFRLDSRTLRGHELLTLVTDAGAVDLIRTIPGVGDYAAVRAAAIPVEAFGHTVPALDLPALIDSKRAVRRPKDLAALPQIEATLRSRTDQDQDRNQGAMRGASATPADAPHIVVGTPPSSPAPSDALATEFRQRVDGLRATRPQAPLDQVDAAALRDVALAHPDATPHALRETLLDGSVALDAGTVADAERYADATVARALLDLQVRAARAAPNRERVR